MIYILPIQRPHDAEPLLWYFDDPAQASAARLAALYAGATVGEQREDYVTDVGELRAWLAESAVEVERDRSAYFAAMDRALPPAGTVDGLEIGACVELEDGTAERVDADENTPDFWTVYWHMTAGGAEAIDDFPSVDKAREFARALAARMGLPLASVLDFA